MKPEEIGRQLAERATRYRRQLADIVATGIVEGFCNPDPFSTLKPTQRCRAEDHRLGRCELPADHEGLHRHGVYGWWPRV